MNGRTSWVRMAAVAMALIGVLLGGPRGAFGKGGTVELASELPLGVTWQALGATAGGEFRFHADALFLQRIKVACGQVSGKLFGMEQITLVEFGQVEVRDWATGAVIATLSTGETFGPTTDETSFYLASPKGHRASVLRFSAGASGGVGDEIPAVTRGTTDCGSGATSEVAAEPATVTELLALDGLSNTLPASGGTFYAGLLTMEPGAALGRAGSEGPSAIATGSGALVVLQGGFGTGRSGLAGSAGPELAPGEVGWTVAGSQVELANAGPIPATALLLGVVPGDAPVLAPR